MSGAAASINGLIAPIQDAFNDRKSLLGFDSTGKNEYSNYRNSIKNKLSKKLCKGNICAILVILVVGIVVFEVIQLTIFSNVEEMLIDSRRQSLIQTGISKGSII